MTFLCQDACNLSSLFEETSVDLISAGLSIHWFDRPKFYAECKKVLRPGGLLVAYGFALNIFEDKMDQEIFDEVIFPCFDNITLIRNNKMVLLHFFNIVAPNPFIHLSFTMAP